MPLLRLKLRAHLLLTQCSEMSQGPIREIEQEFNRLALKQPLSKSAESEEKRFSLESADTLIVPTNK